MLGIHRGTRYGEEVDAPVCRAPGRRGLPGGGAREPAAAQTTDEVRALQRSLDVLIAAYPDFLDRTEGNELVWKDGTRMPFDDGQGTKTYEAILAMRRHRGHVLCALSAGRRQPRRRYNATRAAALPALRQDVRRLHRGEVARNLVGVVWLPRKGGKRLEVTRVNGVDREAAGRLRRARQAARALRRITCSRQPAPTSAA